MSQWKVSAGAESPPMPCLRPILLLCLSLTLLAPSWADTATSIRGGEGAGPFQLFAPFGTVTRELGQPSSQNPSADDPRTVTKFYKQQQLAFLVNPKGEIIGITIARKDWRTPQGLGVGSPLAQFQKLMGQGLKRGPGWLAFPQHGLAVAHKNGTVQTIYVVKKDAKDPAKGDMLLIGGNRAGGIRLGNSAKDMEALLGAPTKKTGSNGNVWVYQNHGVRLAFVNGRVQLIGVSSGDFVTPTGLKVGRPFADLKKEMGAKYRVDRESVFYDQWGLGARLQADKIVELLIFQPRKSGAQG